MKALGFDMPKEEIIAILHEHGVLASGQQPPAVPPTPVHRLQITEQAFIDIMTQKIIARDPMEEISRAFELFAGGSSRQGGGEMKISINELRRVAEELGESVEEEELRAMIDEFDIDNDGMSTNPTKKTQSIRLLIWMVDIVSRDEFIAICRAGV
jgi:centrin-3